MVNQNDQAKLIDYHLKQLPDAEAEQLRLQLQADPQLRAESEAIGRMLQLLDRYGPAVPEDLADRVVADIDRRLQPVRFDPEIVTKPGFAGRLLSLRDLVAAAAMIAVAFGLLVPALNRANEDQRRALCESNLQNLGYGTQMYAAGFGGQLPFAGHRAGAYWMPVKQPGVPVADNRRHSYLLVRQKLANPAWFVCPSRPDGVVMAADRPEAFESFPEPSNTTYSLQCMAGARPRIGEAPAMPIMADQTPLFSGARSAGPLNSPNHGHDGQNVLMMDGRVTWSNRPDVGIGGDNIWLIQGHEQTSYKGVELPASSTDAFLVH